MKLLGYLACFYAESKKFFIYNDGIAGYLIHTVNGSIALSYEEYYKFSKLIK